MIIEAKRRKEERREKRRKKGKQKSNGKQINNVGLREYDSSLVTKDMRPKSSPSLVGGVRKEEKKRKRTEHEISHHGKASNLRRRHELNRKEESAGAEIRAEDEEIALLEKKLGICNDDAVLKTQAVQKLNREYAKLEGFGDDFGDFLSSLDSIWKSSENQPQSYYNDEKDELEEEGLSDNNDDEPSEELVPMKEPQESSSSSSNYEEEEFSDEEEGGPVLKTLDAEDVDDTWSNDTEDDQELHDDSKAEYENPTNAYSPSKGQDIYGNTVAGLMTTSKETKYIPPHLRAAHANITSSSCNTHTDTNQTSLMEQQQLTAVQRSLNGILNRLAESTMDTVTMQIMNLYQTQPSWKVNQCFTERLLQVCVHPTQLMTTLIPTYAATVAAIGCCSTSNSLGCHVLETVTIRYLDQQKQLHQQQQSTIQSSTNNSDDDDEVECFLSDKEPANIILLITYLYNFNVVHCTFLYDIFRHLVQSSFNEINVELLLLILQHSGYQLRSDDPSAMKEMVLLVQQRHQELSCHDAGINDSSSGRRQFFLSAISDIKNNKKNSKVHQQHMEKLVRYRKFLGRIKASSGISSTSTSATCLRVTLQDILDIPTAGRWWRVGNAWKGNSYLGGDNNSQEEGGSNNNNISSQVSSHDNSKKKEGNLDINVEDDVLLQLAAKFGMNTDLRRSIFCVLMGSTDCEDAFEKLMKLKNGNSGKQQHFEREMIRVLVECCGNEKSYNPFYEMLAVRLCDSKGKKFTFQKTYWDLVFKPIDSLKARKAANLAKLAVHLVKERKMSVSVLKVLDVTDLSESGVLFLAVFFVTLLQSCDTDQIGRYLLFISGHRTVSSYLSRPCKPFPFFKTIIFRKILFKSSLNLERNTTR
jgi:nucleolar MIF4G domain-containing protein 1